MATNPNLTADGLRKRYGDVNALDGFDLSVPAGVIHGLLGPNGAGKTTAVKALATLIDVDSGSASVADGTRTPPRTTENRKSRPRNRNFARAYPVSADRNVPITAPPPA